MKIVAAFFLALAIVFTFVVFCYAYQNWHLADHRNLDQAVWAIIGGVFWSNINLLALCHEWE